jgi:hypothetical protein
MSTSRSAADQWEQDRMDRAAGEGIYANDREATEDEVNEAMAMESLERWEQTAETLRRRDSYLFRVLKEWGLL